MCSQEHKIWAARKGPLLPRPSQTPRPPWRTPGCPQRNSSLDSGAANQGTGVGPAPLAINDREGPAPYGRLATGGADGWIGIETGTGTGTGIGTECAAGGGSRLGPASPSNRLLRPRPIPGVPQTPWILPHRPPSRPPLTPGSFPPGITSSSLGPSCCP